MNNLLKLSIENLAREVLKLAVYEKWQSERYNIGCIGCKEWQARCPNCHELVESADPISSNYRFCPYCGFDMKSDFQRVADRRQFTECSMELKKAKILLKAAVEGIESLRPYLAEPYSHICNEKWRYADEALALIGGDVNNDDKRVDNLYKEAEKISNNAGDTKEEV